MAPIHPPPFPPRVVVTGAAGFIGSTLTDALLARGANVLAIDSFDPYYPRARKEAQSQALRAHPRCRFIEGDLNALDLAPLLEPGDAIVHLAARAGVRDSFGATFDAYLDANVRTTQRLLEAAKDKSPSLFLYAGSASIYGDAATEAVDENFQGIPHNPYGLTKWAAERLAFTYAAVFDMPVASARIFSCYGPRERPDKAIQRFLEAARAGRPLVVHGDGTQQRDFTYIDDIVEGLCLALVVRPRGESFNLARGATRPLADVIDIVRDVAGGALDVAYGPPQAGDVRVTSGRIEKARSLLGYAPRVDLEEGIARQWQHVLAHAPTVESPEPDAKKSRRATP